MKKIILLLVLLTLAGCARPELIINDNVIKIEVADTPQEREQGLMFREFLSEDRGMLFVFDEESTQGFWMKNTLIPLEMIFISENATITDIHEAEPCTTHICPVYRGRARYVLEVNKDYSKRHDIGLGDKVETRIISSS